MAKIFLIKPDDEVYGKANQYLINAASKYFVPGVTCKYCHSTWAQTGVQYPTVDCTTLGDLKDLLKIKPVVLEKFLEIKERLRPFLGEERPIFPGTHLGPSYGTAKGKLGDFSWINPWTPLVRESLLIEMSNKNIKINVVQSELRFQGKRREPYYEIEAIPKARLILSSSERVEQCSKCGRDNLRIPDNIIIDRNSFNLQHSLQRCLEFTTLLIVNDNFAHFIEESKASNIVLEEISLI